MNILGIETSCDETSAAVVVNGRDILSNTVISSLKEHSEFGGIIPEIASRRQLECIQSIVQKSLKQAQVPLSKIHTIAVTKNPGLIGSLLVGVSYARALSFALKKPLIDVNHVHAHLYANCLRAPGEKKAQPKLPAIGLVVSGGHTSLYYIEHWNQLKLIGKTRDDAAGEAFDKVARILDLGYPGGPVIDRLAKQGENQSIRFKTADLPGTNDFSFSGVKTAVLYYKEKHQKEDNFSIEKIAFSFQNSVVETLVQKCLKACKKYKVKTLLVGGGVAANSMLRERLHSTLEKEKITIHVPPMSLCMDNAAMIAGYAYKTRA